MALREPEPKKRVFDALFRGLTGTIYPQQLYVLSLKDLQTKGIAGAKASGWRFMTGIGGRDVSVHVESGKRGKPAVATQFSHGTHITSARNAMRKIVKAKEIKKHHYELRLLAVPALGVEAVWLKAGASTPDLIVPYLTKQGLRPMQFYTLDRFLDILKPRAQERAQFDDSPKPRPKKKRPPS